VIGLGAKIFPDRPNLPRISPRISPRSPQLGRSQEVSQARRALRPSPPLGPAGQGPGRAPAQESERPGGKAPRAGILEPGSADHLPNGDAGPLLVVANGQGTAEKIAAALSERLADQGMPPLTNDQLESATTRNWRSDTSSAAGSTNTARPKRGVTREPRTVSAIAAQPVVHPPYLPQPFAPTAHQSGGSGNPGIGVEPTRRPGQQVVADGAAKSSRGCSTGAQARHHTAGGHARAPGTPEKHRNHPHRTTSYDPKCGSLARYQPQNRRDSHTSPFGCTRVVTWVVGTTTGKAPGRFRCACDRRTLGTSRTRRPPAGGSEAARGPVRRSP